MGRKWTDEEVSLFEDHTNKQIAAMTGRTIKSVESKRFVLNHAVESTHDKAERYTKLARIIRLAARLKVKLRG